MKELIDKLSVGVTEYVKPVLEVSVSELNIKIETGKKMTGSFVVSSQNSKELKGIIFSSDERITILNNQFIGQKNIINYSMDMQYAVQGEKIKGDINIISNGGEATIPFEIVVDSASAVTTGGNVKNLFHFANLVQMSYEEALKIFVSKDFPEIFLENDLHLMAVYNGLIGSEDANVAMEEFLVAANKKSPVRVSISKTNQEYKNITENYGDTIIVSKDTWGYVNISVQAEGSFIVVDRKNLSRNDFAGSNYELSYYIDYTKLHPGRNQGRIIFFAGHQTLYCNITVLNENSDSEERIQIKELKSEIVDIVKKYLDFRMHRINPDKWAEESEASVIRARNVHDCMELKLFQAHIYITSGRDSDGAWLLENVAEDLIPVKDYNVDTYCYYLYVRSIQKRDDEFTEEVIKKIRGCYEKNSNDWRLLWLLLYMDETYDDNISMKLLRIKEHYRKGMRSPLLYFEALSAFNKVPELLRVFDEFEIQVLYFGMKNNFITKRLAHQVNEVTATERRFNPLVFDVLTGLYEQYGGDDFLENICSMLIKAGKTDNKYFKWFQKGVNKPLKITNLYESYMYAISMDFEDVIPPIVMMYFVYNSSSLPDEKIDLLYSNVVKNKENILSIYNSYKLQMEKYVADNMLLGRMNRYLAIVYKDVFTKAIIGPEIAEKMPEALNTYELRCNNPMIREVIVVHKEMNNPEKYPLIKGKANVKIFTEDYAIVFEDVYGNRYHKTIDYSIEKLLHMEEYLKMCYEICTGNKFLVLYFGDKYLKYRKNTDKGISILKYMLTMDDLVKPFKLQLENEVIDYYSTNYDGDSLDEYLLSTDVNSLGSLSRVKIMELTIVRGLYDRAYELMQKFGYSQLEPRRILKCAKKLIEFRDYAEDKLLTDMSLFAFDKGKYCEETLIYLGKYYNGTTKELLKIWRASKGFECESRDLEERIIVQMLFTGAYVGSIEEIYDSYFRKAANLKIKRAYLFSKAYDYFVKENIIEDSIFKYIATEVYNGDEVNDMCAIAYLKHMSEKQDIYQREELEMCRNLIYDLSRNGKVFEFYKKFKKYFKLPFEIADKTVVEYRTNPESHVCIHYMMDEPGNEEYTVAEMKNVCDGVFTYQFVLFYNESILYYITEETDGVESITESKRLTVSEVNFSDDSTHYGTINDILVCREMHEENTLKEMAKEYALKKKLIENVFTVM